MSSSVHTYQGGRLLRLAIGWVFALFVVVTAINAPPEQKLGYRIPFWGLFQEISDNNRLLSSGLALGLIALCLVARVSTSNARWSMVVALLLALHILIFGKNCFSVGLSAFSFLIGLVLLLVATRLVAEVLTTAGTTRWWPLVLASLGFLAANLIQYRVNPAATMQVSGRFHGLTSNPQMYALTVAIMLPALLFQYTRNRRLISRGVVLFAFLLLLFFALYSGSRLSLLLGAASVLMYYRARIAQLTAFIVPALILIIFWAFCGDQLPVASHSHITSTDDTRSMVWRIQVNSFFNHPIVGKPLEPGERAGFGENSYLAAGATLGLPGLMLAVSLAFVLGRNILALMQLERRVGWHPELALPIAVLSSCLLGGFFEAFLLGIFTFPLTALLYTVFASEELLRRTNGHAPVLPRLRLLAIAGAGSIASSPIKSPIGFGNQTGPFAHRRRWPRRWQMKQRRRVWQPVEKSAR